MKNETLQDKCYRLEKELKKIDKLNLSLEEKNIQLRKQKLKLEKENINLKEELAELKRPHIDFSKFRDPNYKSDTRKQD